MYFVLAINYLLIAFFPKSLSFYEILVFLPLTTKYKHICLSEPELDEIVCIFIVYVWIYYSCVCSLSVSIHIHTLPFIRKEGNVLFNDALNTFYLRLYGVRHMVKDHWDSREETCCRHIGYSFRLAARVLLYASSHRQDNTYHGLCYTSRGALAGTRNSSMGPPHEGSIRRPIAPWANALTTELHLAPYLSSVYPTIPICLELNTVHRFRNV